MTTKEKMKNFVRAWQKVKRRKHKKELKKENRKILNRMRRYVKYCMFKYGIIKKEEYRK